MAKNTYLAAWEGIAPAASATDVVEIAGAANKVIRVLRMGFTTQQTTAGGNLWRVIKRSTANSGGTAGLPTRVPKDSIMGASTAVVKTYTENPTIGDAVGTVWAGYVNSPAPATAGTGGGETVIDFCDNEYGSELGLVLRGTAQVLALNANGASITGGKVSGWIEWTEEAA